MAEPVPELPSFLFFYLPHDELERSKQGELLRAPVGRELLLYADDEAVPRPPRAPVQVVDAARAVRHGARFARRGEGWVCEAIPLRYVLSARRAYVREVSAGGVLVRGCGPAAEFALMRTLPRKEAVARRSARLASQADGSDEIPAPADDASEFSDPRTGDRRQRERRRRSEPRPPGEERRRGRSRRLRRRRRSARWGPEGRLELPKGKLEPGESAQEAAVREVREELGFDGALAVRGLLSKNHYSFRTPDGRLIFKTVHYFLLACEEEDPSFAPRAEEGVVGVEWWSGERAIQQVAFPNLKPVLEKAWGLLQG